MGDVGELNWVNREGAKKFFVGFVLILEKGFRIRTTQALAGDATKLKFEEYLKVIAIQRFEADIVF